MISMYKVKYLVVTFLRKFLLNFLLTLAYIGIDFKSEIESLRNDFVNSKRFTSAVNKIFDDCDVNRDNALDAGEFFCATLLFYYNLNRIPYLGKNTPPKRKDIAALFYRYVVLQEKAEKSMGIKGAFNDTLSSSKLVHKLVSSSTTSTSKILPVVDKALKHRREFQYFSKVLIRRVTKPLPFIIVSVIFFVSELCTALFTWAIGRSVPLQRGDFVIRWLSLFLVTLVLLAVYHVVDIKKNCSNYIPDEIDDTLNKLPSSTKVKDTKKLNENIIFKHEKRRGRTNTLVRLDFMSEKMKDKHMRRETFLFLCQRQFTNLVIAETWRISWKIIVIPLFSYQLKKILDYFLMLTVVFVNDLGFFEDPFKQRQVPLSVAMSLTMTILRVIIEPVSASIMWDKVHEAITRDMLAQQHEEAPKKGYFQKLIKRFTTRNKPEEDDSTLGHLTQLYRKQRENSSRSQGSQTRAKDERKIKTMREKKKAKEEITGLVGIRKRRRTRELSAVETTELRRTFSAAEAQKEV